VKSGDERRTSQFSQTEKRGRERKAKHDLWENEIRNRTKNVSFTAALCVWVCVSSVHTRCDLMDSWDNSVGFKDTSIDERGEHKLRELHFQLHMMNFVF